MSKIMKDFYETMGHLLHIGPLVTECYIIISQQKEGVGFLRDFLKESPRDEMGPGTHAEPPREPLRDP